VLASLPLQIFLYFGSWWGTAYWLLSLAIFICKGFTLPYPTPNFAVEFVFLFLYLLVEPARLFLGERRGPGTALKHTSK
jgi:transmembrane protein 216